MIHQPFLAPLDGLLDLLGVAACVGVQQDAETITMMDKEKQQRLIGVPRMVQTSAH